MSKEEWAGIVYGRSYHLDFRLIALPEDFAQLEIDWAMPYILATIQQPKKLALNPRWSLFKNQSHCVVGVTCMVRDLLAAKDFSLTKDDRDRSLYIFVGYVTKLVNKKYLTDLPPYNPQSLQAFQGLYNYVKQIWQVKDFDKNSHQSLKTEYKTYEFSPQSLLKNFSIDLLKELNYQEKNPDQVFLWQHQPETNRQLWATAAICPQSISLCLGNKKEQQCLDNPFLNQSINIANTLVVQSKCYKNQSFGELSTRNPHEVAAPFQVGERLTEILVNKVRQDITITRDRALQLKQLLTNNLSHNYPQKTQAKSNSPERKIANNFGLKVKTSHSKATELDWF
ncbi:MAG TPA: hypothetical protein ACFCUY_08120 [Xenococcaceae cyanobacterium]